MSEEQESKIVKTLKTSSWYYLGDKENWKVYETNNNVLFAISKVSQKVSFEVYLDEEEEFLIY